MLRYMYIIVTHVLPCSCFMVKMPRLDVSMRRCGVLLHRNGCSIAEIRARLIEENVPVSLGSIYKLLKKYEDTGNIVDCKRRPSTPKFLQPEHLHFLDEALVENDELTAENDELIARKLQDILEER